MRRISACMLLSLTLSPTLASAAETITYTYDARGRVVKVARSGSINSGIVTDYTHDRANNRTKVKTTGSATNAPP